MEHAFFPVFRSEQRIQLINLPLGNTRVVHLGDQFVKIRRRVLVNLVVRADLLKNWLLACV